jgi:hypothetical protein
MRTTCITSSQPRSVYTLPPSLLPHLLVVEVIGGFIGILGLQICISKLYCFLTRTNAAVLEISCKYRSYRVRGAYRYIGDFLRPLMLKIFHYPSGLSMIDDIQWNSLNFRQILIYMHGCERKIAVIHNSKPLRLGLRHPRKSAGVKSVGSVCCIR